MEDWQEKEKLHIAAQEGDLAAVETLIKEGYDVNLFDSDLSRTPLHYAAIEEHIDIVRFLIAAGANVNAHDLESIGETPLGAVAATCSVELAEVLVDAGADPTIPGWMQLTALHRAAARKKPEGRRVHELLNLAASHRIAAARKICGKMTACNPKQPFGN